MPFNYTNITTKGFEGSLNLFFNRQIVALVDNVNLANEIRKEIPEHQVGKNAESEEGCP